MILNCFFFVRLIKVSQETPIYNSTRNTILFFFFEKRPDGRDPKRAVGRPRNPVSRSQHRDGSTQISVFPRSDDGGEWAQYIYYFQPDGPSRSGGGRVTCARRDGPKRVGRAKTLPPNTIRSRAPCRTGRSGGGG